MYLFPKGGQFKYDFTKGKPWQYDNLYATFDFSIQKEDKEIDLEKQELAKNNKHYFEYDIAIVTSVKSAFTTKVNLMQANGSMATDALMKFVTTGNFVINKIYETGFVAVSSQGKIVNEDEIIYLRKSNEVEEVVYNRLLLSKDVFKVVTDNIGYAKYT